MRGRQKGCCSSSAAKDEYNRKNNNNNDFFLCVTRTKDVEVVDGYGFSVEYQTIS